MGAQAGILRELVRVRLKSCIWKYLWRRQYYREVQNTLIIKTGIRDRFVNLRMANTFIDFNSTFDFYVSFNRF